MGSRFWGLGNKHRHIAGASASLVVMHLLSCTCCHALVLITLAPQVYRVLPLFVDVVIVHVGKHERVSKLLPTSNIRCSSVCACLNSIGVGCCLACSWELLISLCVVVCVCVCVYVCACGVLF